MKYIIRFFFLVFSFYHHFALAQSDIWVPVSIEAAQAPRFMITYREGHRYFADVYKVNLGEYQTRVEQRVFRSQEELNVYTSGWRAQDGHELSAWQNSLKLPQTEVRDEVIWPVENFWDTDWEAQYANWITENVDDEFYIRYNLATDCADVAISLRWIFARIHHLPVANTLAGTENLFSNESMRTVWRDLPTADDWHQDLRFLAALDYVLENTYTHTLMIDSYPVAIDPKIFMPGVHHLNLYSEETGHTMLVSEVNRELGGVFLLYSNVPRRVRPLAQEYFQDSFGYSSPNRGGFLKIRWAEKKDGRWMLRGRDQMPGYSLEQYDEHFAENYGSFAEAIEARLGAQTSPLEKFRQGLRTLRGRLNARLQIVEEGYDFCLSHDCSEGTSGYEDWSTPSRDKRIEQLVQYLALRSADGSQFRKLWSDFKNQEFLTILGEIVRMSVITRVFDVGRYSYNPRDSIRRRWGLD